jgi:hypothetical protein
MSWSDSFTLTFRTSSSGSPEMSSSAPLNECELSPSEILAATPELVFRTVVAGPSATAANVSVPMNGTTPLESVLGAAGKRLHVTLAIRPSYQILAVLTYLTSFGETLGARAETGNVSITIGMQSVDVSALSATSAIPFRVSAVVVVQPLGEPCNASLTLQFACVFGPLRREGSGLLSSAVVEKTFQGSTIVSSLFLNPVTALSNTGVASIASVAQCIFSDVDPLDGSIAPLGDWVGFGAAVGKHYRGAVVAGLAAIFGSGAVLRTLIVLIPKLSAKWTEDDVRSYVRFPSILLVPMGALNQGVVTCSVALIRLHANRIDLVIAGAGLSVAIGSTVVLLLAGTKWLRVYREPRRSEELTSQHAFVAKLLAVAVWKEHWVEDGTHAINPADLETSLLHQDDDEQQERGQAHTAFGFKKRYQLLLDDMSAPWWIAFEMAINVVQGAILGLRINDEDVCHYQRSMLAALSGFALAVTCVVRPCGSYVALVFLVLTKLGTFGASLFVAVSRDAWASEVVENITVFMGLLSVVIAAAQVTITIVVGRKAILKALRFRRKMVQKPPVAAQLGGSRAAAANPTTAGTSDTSDTASSISLDMLAPASSAAAANPTTARSAAAATSCDESAMLQPAVPLPTIAKLDHDSHNPPILGGSHDKKPPRPERRSKDMEDTAGWRQGAEMASVLIGQTPLEKDDDLRRAYRRLGDCPCPAAQAPLAPGPPSAADSEEEPPIEL